MKVKLFHGGILYKDFSFMLEHGIKLRYFLYSFADKERLRLDFEKFLYPGCSLIIDSGAFSVWRSGRTIDFDEYISFVKNKIDDYSRKGVDVYAVNLDVIPGNEGMRKYTDVQLREAAEAGWRNYLYFKNKLPKDRIINIFHEGDPIDYLHRLIDDCAYLGISPSDYSVKGKDADVHSGWLRRIFSMCPSGIKFHGFGLIAEKFVLPFPWYSVDSVRYKISAAYGKVITPMGDIDVSKKAKWLHSDSKMYIENVAAELGLGLDDLANDSYTRRYYNLYYLETDYLLKANEVRFEFVQDLLY